MKGIAGLMGWIASPFRAQQSVVETNLTPMSSRLIEWLGGMSAAGKAVSEETVMGLSAMFACQRIISESVGALPRQMFEKAKDGSMKAADDHWLADVLIDTPNKDQDDVGFWETLTANLCGNGNSYSLKETAGTRVTSLYPMISARVTVMRKAGSNTNEASIRDGDVFFRFNDRGRYMDLPREKVWHVRGFGRDPIVGLSPVGAAREALGGAIALDDFAHRFFSQGGFPAGIVSVPNWLKEDQRKIARENLQQVIGGIGNMHRFALFEGGMKPEPWESMNLEDMQFILARRFSVLEICRLYLVPPHMVAELEKGASYASIEQMSIEFVTYCLLPYLRRFERSVNKWLLGLSERGRILLKFNFDGLLRADSKSRAEYESILVNNGIMTRNEVRAKENLNRATDKNMDAFTVQSAMVPIDKIGEKPEPAAPAPGRAPDEDREDGDVERGGRRAPATQTNLATSIVIPEALRHRVEHDVPELRDSFAALQASVERMNKGTAQMAGALAKIVDRQIDLEEALTESGQAIGGAIENLAKGHGELAEKVDQLANQEREVTVGTETFVSKPHRRAG